MSEVIVFKLNLSKIKQLLVNNVPELHFAHSF